MSLDYRGLRVASHPSSHCLELSPNPLSMMAPKTPTLRPRRCERSTVSRIQSSGNLARLAVRISTTCDLHHRLCPHRSLHRTTRASLQTINLIYSTFRLHTTHRKPITRWTTLRRHQLRVTFGWSKITGTDSVTTVRAGTHPTSYARRCASVKRNECGRTIERGKCSETSIVIGAGFPRDNPAGGTRMVSRKGGRAGNSRCKSMFRGIYGHDGAHSPVMEGTIGVGLPLGEGERSEGAFMVAVGGGAFPIISGLGRTRLCLRLRLRHLCHSRCSPLRSTRSMGMVLTHHQNLNRTMLPLLHHSRVYRSRQPPTW
jgi:hypothetical protein